MSYILTQVYKKNSNKWIYQIFYNTLTEAKNVFDKLTEKYPQYMKKINQLELKLSSKENSLLKFKELNEEEGLYIGQVNSKDEKNGRGAFILHESQNCKIGYWDNNNMKGEGTE